MFWNFTCFAVLSFVITIAKVCHNNGSVKTFFDMFFTFL